jgi:S1-C subfamily serine protease
VTRRAVAATVLAVVAAGCGGAESPDRPAPPVVSVLATGSERATGFAVAPGRVVTVAHAVPGGRSVGLDSPARSAHVLRRDRSADLALIAVRGLPAPGVETAAAKAGDSVRLLLLRDGRVAGRSATVRRAIEAHVRGPGSSRPLRRPALELDVRVRAGDSGAPVLTGDGRLAGVLFARSRNRSDTAYAVDARGLDEFLSENGG